MGSTIGKLKPFAVFGILLTASAAYIPLAPKGHDSAKTTTTAPVKGHMPADLPGGHERKDDESAVKKEDKAKTPEKTDEAASQSADTASTADEVATKPAEKKVEREEAQLEVYVPSVVKLAHAFEASKTAELVDVVRKLIPKPDEIAGEDKFDVSAFAKLSEHVLSWPDTSLTFTTFSQDRDGRPRWALCVDWPIDAVVSRVQSLLADDSAKHILENVRLVEGDDNAWRLELPDMVLAYLRPTEHGSMLTATETLMPPTKVYGMDEYADRKGRHRDTRLFCRLNLDAGDEGSRNPMFATFIGVSSVDYDLRLLKNGSWREMFIVKWNAMIGLAAKAIFQKTKSRFECPNDAFVNAVLDLGTISKSAPDSISGLPRGTIGTRTTGDMAFTLMPGTGVIPIPDTYYQFRTGPRHLLLHRIRNAIEKDTKKRRDDDRRPAWHEENIDGNVVFWRDPTADGSYGLTPATFRTVVFFQPPLSAEEKNHDAKADDDDDDPTTTAASDDDDQPRMVVVATTSTWADDAVRNFRKQLEDARTMPTSKKMDWQARVNWNNAYKLAYPYLAIGIGLSEDASLPPEPKEIESLLSESRVDVKISLGGFLARHIGPAPVGGVYIPALAAMTLNSSADPGSEIAREQTACRRLRVLYHHCKLFKKDYGRWPATVAELDGYVDFASHPQLLRLRDKKVGMLTSFAKAFAIEKDDDSNSHDNGSDVSDDEIDDTLYEIDWSSNDADWRLKLREGEFVAYKTIYIDAKGRIHRVPKTDEKTARSDKEASSSESPKL